MECNSSLSYYQWVRDKETQEPQLGNVSKGRGRN